MPEAVAHVEIARITHVLADSPDDASSWLSESEQQRLANIRHEARRSQFLAGHWLTRAVLARSLGGTPMQWRLLERRSLPPQVQDHAESLRVSISHTMDWVAAAIANTAIGIDLEQRPRALDASVERLLLDADEASGSVDPDTLLQRWVAKEAWLKRAAASALPVQLKRLRLRPTAGNHADIRIDSNAAFHFALAATRDCTVKWHGDVVLTPGAGFQVDHHPV